MSAEETIAQPHKAILTIVLLMTLGLALKQFSLFNLASTSGRSTRSYENLYPSLYCRYHECPPCSADRPILKAGDEVVFDLRPRCLQWFRTPYGRHFNWDDLEEHGYVIEYVDSHGRGLQALPVLPHQPLPDLGGRPCGDRGCELAVSGDGKFRVQVDK